MRKVFMKQALAGEVTDLTAVILDAIEAWHKSPAEGDQPLHTWLGLSSKEYASFVVQGDAYINQIVKERKAQARRAMPEHITMLQPGQCFVFGSNEGARHSRGAAKDAMRWGARRSVPAGPAGQTYAIPTKTADLRVLCLRDISKYVQDFIEHASQRHLIDYLVTAVGCGLAGYAPRDIAPLFADAIDLPNVYLPLRFWQVLWTL